MHRHVLSEWGDVVYLDCVHLTGISWSPAGDCLQVPRFCADSLLYVLGLRNRYPGAAPVQVLLGRAKESVQVLIPDAKVTDRRFLCLLRRQWPVMVVSGMSRKQTVSWCTQWKGTPQDYIDHIRH